MSDASPGSPAGMSTGQRFAKASSVVSCATSQVIVAASLGSAALVDKPVAKRQAKAFKTNQWVGSKGGSARSVRPGAKPRITGSGAAPGGGVPTARRRGKVVPSKEPERQVERVGLSAGGLSPPRGVRVEPLVGGATWRGSSSGSGEVEFSV